MMDEILLLEAVERYIKGEMTPQEKAFFEDLRKNNAEVDQAVVEQTFLFNELERHAALKSFKHTLYEVENQLSDEGLISKPQLSGKAKVVAIWKKYKRNIAVAASIAGLVSLFTTALVVTYNNKVANNDIRTLSGKIDETRDKVDDYIRYNTIKNGQFKPMPQVKFRSTGFLVDGRGYIVTNAHVVNSMSTLYVQSNKGIYLATAVHVDPASDVAILKILDTSFKALPSLPYSIRKSNTDLGERIFTLGYPRNEIVYGEGYLSAKSGNDGDSTAYQLSIAANPGNSGAPVLNNNGEIIGIITSKNATADGVVFAAKSKNIFKLVDELKKSDTAYANIKLPSGSSLKGMDRTQQIKKLEDYVFMVLTNK